jgi:CheY-like chemotaxis protein
MSALPIFSFPCRIVCVDDFSIFLETLKNVLSRRLYQVECFENPLHALLFFQEYTSPLLEMPLLQSCIDHELYRNANHAPVDLNLKNLMDLSKYANRYDKIGIAIIDYTMPGMNGIELCEQISHLPVKKILLTGTADGKTVLDAYNKGVIDFFMPKNHPDLTKTLLECINYLAKKYFIKITSNIRNHLEVDNKLPISDPVFVNAFSKWVLDHNIKEYYLVDKNGSFLLIDNNGAKSYFIVHTDHSLREFINIYDDDQTVTPFINGIEQRKKLPFFGPDTHHEQIVSSEWGQYFHEPQVIDGKNRYYWYEEKVI